MIKLHPEQVNALLDLVNDPKDKKALQAFLWELQKPTMDPSKPVNSSLRNKRLAKKALEIICRVGIELIKHEVYSDLLHLLD